MSDAQKASGQWTTVSEDEIKQIQKLLADLIQSAPQGLGSLEIGGPGGGGFNSGGNNNNTSEGGKLITLQDWLVRLSARMAGGDYDATDLEADVNTHRKRAGLHVLFKPQQFFV